MSSEIKNRRTARQPVEPVDGSEVGANGGVYLTVKLTTLESARLRMLADDSLTTRGGLVRSMLREAWRERAALLEGAWLERGGMTVEATPEDEE